MTSVVFWFRKDLRLADHPALNQALNSGSKVFLVATADQVGSKFDALSITRQNSLRSSWRHLSDDLAGKLLILQDPNELSRFASENHVERVHVSDVFDTNGVKELNAVERDLNTKNIKLVRGPGNYAVRPGTVTKADGSSYRVYTPFYKEWHKLANDLPVSKAPLSSVQTAPAFVSRFNPQLQLGLGTIAGEKQALRTLEQFLENRVDNYDENRNRPDLGSTSHLSHALSHGEIHPRTILNSLPDNPGAEVFRKEIAWREFYADVLWQRPDTLTEYLDGKFAKMRYNSPNEQFDAWKAGKTGYPIVDAGMRQLLATGWMHNRVRMIVASFLIKDLHLEWQHGAEWFEQNLTDFDPASNSHGWQWTAGCGTDASPYYRIFNPITQGLKFDPNGDYVRKFVPELRHLTGADALEPWNYTHGYSEGYPKQIVDHAKEREEALIRLEELKFL